MSITMTSDVSLWCTNACKVKYYQVLLCYCTLPTIQLPVYRSVRLHISPHARVWMVVNHGRDWHNTVVRLGLVVCVILLLYGRCTWVIKGRNLAVAHGKQTSTNTHVHRPYNSSITHTTKPKRTTGIMPASPMVDDHPHTVITAQRKVSRSHLSAQMTVAMHVRSGAADLLTVTVYFPLQQAPPLDFRLESLF